MVGPLAMRYVPSPVWNFERVLIGLKKFFPPCPDVRCFDVDICVL